MDADLAEEIRDVKEKILEVEAQVKALPVGHAERRLHLECLAALQSQLASLRQQGTRLPLMHGLCMAPPVSPLHGVFSFIWHL